MAGAPMKHRPLRRFAHLSATLILTCCCRTSIAQHKAVDSYPYKVEEYDYSVLDPHHVFGSPLGGFSRASRSRLASMPLPLPALLADDKDGNIGTLDPIFTTFRNDQGKLFACRVYLADELADDSLSDSLFDAPKLRNEVDRPIRNDQSAYSVSAFSEKAQKAATLAITGHDDGRIGYGGQARAAAKTLDGDERQHNAAADKSVPANTQERVLLVARRLQQLHGICGQVHKGYWSYEYCFAKGINSFHIELDQETMELTVSDLIRLGQFAQRQTYGQPELLPKSNELLAQGQSELARVLDMHVGGDVCKETGQARQTMVHIQCCSAQVIESRKGLIHRDNTGISTNLAAIYELVEDPDAICSYNMTVCTPLLCADYNDDAGTTLTPSSSSTSQTQGASRPKENETIREILDRTLGNTCIAAAPNGWWSMELCHTKFVRQYHEVIQSTRGSNGATFSNRVIEAEYILGYYPDDVVNSREEYALVVNATSLSGGGGTSKAPGSSGTAGPSSYYELEYKGGDVCGDADVLERAVIAGQVFNSETIERAASVRFYCGEKYEVTFNEDSTCHYIVEVRVPDLCKHPLFKAPERKKRVFKCLPVDEE